MVFTEWRLKYRPEINDRDTDANTKAVDSLLNYETVKYFSNEDHEAQRYDVSMKAYEKAAVRSMVSLAAVNIGQGALSPQGL
jgi:ATP-binding cassette subfamily B protein